MIFKETLLKLLHKIYRKSTYLNDFFEAVQQVLNKIQSAITRIEFLLHFNKLDEKGCEWWESLLKITDINPDINNRRSKIRAKFLACTHNDIILLQNVCDSWKNGVVEAGFKNKKIQIKFSGLYGIPENLDSLLNAIEYVKPAHLPYQILYKYLLIENIHNTKTIKEMKKITLDMFAKGVEI